jgi:hypothetical protein
MDQNKLIQKIIKLENVEDNISYEDKSIPNEILTDILVNMRKSSTNLNLLISEFSKNNINPDNYEYKIMMDDTRFLLINELKKRLK